MKEKRKKRTGRHGEKKIVLFLRFKLRKSKTNIPLTH